MYPKSQYLVEVRLLREVHGAWPVLPVNLGSWILHDHLVNLVPIHTISDHALLSVKGEQ